MPKPIPPPPPQASLQETRAAVRLSVALFGAALALFFAVSPAFAIDGWMMDYGRDYGLSWNQLRLEQLDEQALRAQGDGRVVWLVGPSILRDAIDEELLNQQLDERGSGLTAIKFGVERAAPSISAGLVERLPLRPGDVVVSSMAASNFRPDWLSWSKLPNDMVTRSMPVQEFWRVGELSFRDKLEGTILYAPGVFWGHRGEAQAGLTAWLRTPWDGVPKKTRPRWHLSSRGLFTYKGYDRTRVKKSTRRHRTQGLEDFDLGPDQVNVRGVARLREACDDAGAELLLVDFPTSALMARELTLPEVHQAYGAQKQAWGVVDFPQVPDEFFYDYHHNNAPGRVLHTVHMAELLARY